MALACSVLRNKGALDALLSDAGMKDEETRHPPWLLRVIVCDATFGGRVVAPAGHSPTVHACMRLVRSARAGLLDAYRRLQPPKDAGSAGTAELDIARVRLPTLPR